MKKFFTLIAAVVLSTFGAMAQEKEFGPNLTTNSDFEGDDYTWVGIAAKPSKDNEGAKILLNEELKPLVVENEDGHCLAVKVAANPSQPWDAQIWVVLPEDIQTGEQVTISFKYRAEFSDESIEDITAGTQGHKEPGSYLNNTGLGDVTFTKEWQTFDNSESPFTVPANQKSIAFNLSVNKDYEVTYYIDDIVIRREVADESLIDYWKPIITNGDCEADACPNFIVKEFGKEQGEAVPEEGVGVDGSAGIHIHVPARDANDHDSQFFLYLNNPIPANDIIRVSFKYRASETLDETADKDSWRDHKAIGGQAHAKPGEYITWNSGFAEMHATPEWQIYEGDYQISSDASPSDNFQTMAFNLAIVTDHDYDIYLDDFVVKHKVKVPAGTDPNELAIEELCAELDTKYSNMEAFDVANKVAIEEFQEAYGTAKSAGEGEYEQAYEDLIKAESKYKSSVKDYSKLKSYIDMIDEKVELVPYELLAEQLKAIADPLRDAYVEASWTKADINAVINEDSIYTMVSEYLLENMTEGTDISAIIINPNYTFGKNGWNGSVTANNGAAERYHTSFNVSQTIKGLKKGGYIVRVKGFQRIDDEGEMSAQLYANSATKLLVNRDEAEDAPEEAPNDLGSSAAAFAAGNYANELTAVLTADGDLTIGVKGTNANIWTAWSQVRLVYAGMTKEALAAAILDQVDATDEVAIALEDNELINNETLDKESKLTEGAKKMAEGIADATEEQVTKMLDDLVAMIDEMNEVAKTVQTAKDAYTTYSDVYDEYYGEATAAAKERADKVTKMLDTEDGLLALTTEELKTLATEMVDLVDALKIKAAAYDATDAAPFDFTYLFVDPDFEDYSELGANKNYPGWSGTGFTTGGGTAGPVGERWNNSTGFDTYVDFTYLPEGTYEISCDGAYRIAGSVGNADYDVAVNDSTTDQAAYLYAITDAGKREVAIHNIFEGKLTEAEVRAAWKDYIGEEDEIKDCDKYTVDDVTYYFPNQLATADRFMQLSNKYKGNKVAFHVGADGKARVGLARYAGQGSNWAFVDNFVLKYYGADSSIETPVETIQITNNAAQKAIFTISGVRVSNANKAGLYIINGKKVVVK